jgi:hypothetical protein
MTWPNIYRNLKNIDYCTEQFNYVRFAIERSYTCVYAMRDFFGHDSCTSEVWT